MIFWGDIIIIAIGVLINWCTKRKVKQLIVWKNTQCFDMFRPLLSTFGNMSSLVPEAPAVDLKLLRISSKYK